MVSKYEPVNVSRFVFLVSDSWSTVSDKSVQLAVRAAHFAALQSSPGSASPNTLGEFKHVLIAAWEKMTERFTFAHAYHIHKGLRSLFLQFGKSERELGEFDSSIQRFTEAIKLQPKQEEVSIADRTLFDIS